MRRRLKKVLTVCCAAYLILWCGWLARYFYHGAPDLVYLGKHRVFWCSLFLDPLDSSGSIGFYKNPTTAPRIGTSSTGWFFFHRVATGGIWSIASGSAPTKVVRQDYVLLGWTDTYRGSVLDEQCYWAYPRFLPILVALGSVCWLGLLSRQAWKSKKYVGFPVITNDQYKL